MVTLGTNICRTVAILNITNQYETTDWRHALCYQLPQSSLRPAQTILTLNYYLVSRYQFVQIYTSGSKQHNNGSESVSALFRLGVDHIWDIRRPSGDSFG